MTGCTLTNNELCEFLFFNTMHDLFRLFWVIFTSGVSNSISVDGKYLVSDSLS